MADFRTTLMMTVLYLCGILLTEAYPALDLPGIQVPSKRTDADDLADSAVDSGVDVYFENAEEWTTLKVTSGTRGLVLECVVVTSGASATLYWLYDGQRIVQGPSDLRVADEAAAFEEVAGGSGGPDVKTVSKLSMDCVDRRNAGKYTCVVDTPQSRKSISRNVDVVDGDRVGEKQCAAARQQAPVRIYMFKKSHDDYSGRTIQLFCRASGFPRPRTQWYYAGGSRPVRLQNGDKYEVLDNGDLVIKNLDGDDFGDYVCQAFNGVSHASATTNVYVYASP